jgi:hypothetical protein
MAYVDPERFKRFEQFLSRYMPYFADGAARGFAAKGPGVVIFRPGNDQFDVDVSTVQLEYKTKAQIDAAQGETRDELIQGMLERYQPPGEALLVAIYPDNSYDVSRVIIKRQAKPGGAPN